MIDRFAKERARRFRQYLKDHSEEAAGLVGETVLKDSSYLGALTFGSYAEAIEHHISYLNTFRIPHTRIRSRADIEKETLETLRDLKTGDSYLVKAGDADYLTEEAGKWNQVGSEEVQKAYSEATQRGVEIIIVACQEPFRKSTTKGTEVAQVPKKLGVEMKVIDHPLRAVFAERVGEWKRALAWYSFTRESVPFSSHDPDISTYKGYTFSASKGDPQEQFAESLRISINELKERGDIVEDFLGWMKDVEKDKAIPSVTTENGHHEKDGHAEE